MLELLVVVVLSGAVGLVVYAIPFSMLVLAFVVDLFLVTPENVAFLLAQRGKNLLIIMSGICFLGFVFWLEPPLGYTAAFALQAMLVEGLTAASMRTDVYRGDRVGMLVWLLWLTIPATAGSALLQTDFGRSIAGVLLRPFT